MGGQSLYDDLAYVKLELDNVAWLQERSSHGEYGALMNLLSGFPFAVGVLSALCKSATSAFQQSSRHRHQRSSALQDCRNKLQSPALFSESMETTRRASNDWLRVLGCASQTSNPIRAPVIGFLAPIPCITDPPCSLQIISPFRRMMHRLPRCLLVLAGESYVQATRRITQINSTSCKGRPTSKSLSHLSDAFHLYARWVYGQLG